MAKESSTGFSLKDHLFNRNRVEYLAELLTKAVPRFDRNKFVKDVMKRLTKLELKQRIVHIAEVLEHHLSDDFAIATKQIVDSLPPPLDPLKSDDDFGDFIIAPLGEFVVRNGLSREHLKRSLRTLRELTMRFSMEDAIRRFINQFPDLTLAELRKWSRDKNYHVRRLVSEGTRPRLPWSGRLHIDPREPLEFLHQLHSDQTRYVTRSVANHLNDLSKLDGICVVDVLHAWKQQQKQNEAELKWMTRHALRTLVKQGDTKALRFLGFQPDPKIEVLGLKLSSTKLKPGESLQFEFDVVAKRDELLVVDYVIDFVKANKKTAAKVFKLKQVELTEGQTLRMQKKHPLRANATTFTLYPGMHNLTIQINGTAQAEASFELK